MSNISLGSAQVATSSLWLVIQEIARGVGRDPMVHQALVESARIVGSAIVASARRQAHLRTVTR